MTTNSLEIAINQLGDLQRLVEKKLGEQPYGVVRSIIAKAEETRHLLAKMREEELMRDMNRPKGGAAAPPARRHEPWCLVNDIPDAGKSLCNCGVSAPLPASEGNETRFRNQPSSVEGSVTTESGGDGKSPLLSSIDRAMDAARDLARMTGTPILHRSDCALHNGPAFKPGPCDCGAEPGRTPEDYFAAPAPQAVEIPEGQPDNTKLDEIIDGMSSCQRDEMRGWVYYEERRMDVLRALHAKGLITETGVDARYTALGNQVMRRMDERFSGCAASKAPADQVRITEGEDDRQRAALCDTPSEREGWDAHWSGTPIDACPVGIVEDTRGWREGWRQRENFYRKASADQVRNSDCTASDEGAREKQPIRTQCGPSEGTEPAQVLDAEPSNSAFIEEGERAIQQRVEECL